MSTTQSTTGYADPSAISAMLRTGRGGEGSHFYRLTDGGAEACYEVRSQTGKKCPTCGGSLRNKDDKARTLACGECDDRGLIYPFREVTLADIKRLRGMGERFATGISRVTQMKAAPGLVRYAVEQAVLASLTAPDSYRELAEPERVRRIMDDAEAHAREAREEGTRVHTAKAQAIAGEEYDPAYAGHVTAMWAALEQFGPVAWCAEQIALSRYGYATAIDARGKCPDGRNIVINWKGRDTVSDGDGPYDEQVIQLAAECALFPNSRGYIGLFARKGEPCVRLVEVEPEALERGWEQFKLLLALRCIEDRIEWGQQ